MKIGRPPGKLRRKPSRRKIVQQVIADHFITEEIFFSNSKWTVAVKARRDAILRLAADGAYQAEIAALIKRERTMVRYHLQPHRRNRTDYYAKKYRELKKNDPVRHKEIVTRRNSNAYFYDKRVKQYELIRKERMQSLYENFSEAAE